MLGPMSQRKPPPSSLESNDSDLLARLRDKDETAFETLVSRYQSSMVNFAHIYLNQRTVAEEVVQETWIGVLRGLHRFEGRSSLKTWIFSILANRAKTWALREGRYINLSELDNADTGVHEAAVSADRFNPADHPQWPYHWKSAPESWDEVPEARLLSQEIQECIRKAIDALPTKQRAVITLRDIEELSSDEVCNVLALSESNQRVLLHRARSQVRRVLEEYFQGQKR